METIQKDRQALIALGANENSLFGTPDITLVEAIVALATESVRVISVSRLFRTPAFPAGSGPDYVNAAVRVATDLSPQALLDRLHAIEDAAGRVRTRRWGARTLDLDLLAMDGDILPDPAVLADWISLSQAQQASTAPRELILPHPRMQDRAFVLVPLCDIAADWRHPLTGCTAAGMLSRLPDADRAEVRPL